MHTVCSTKRHVDSSADPRDISVGYWRRVSGETGADWDIFEELARTRVLYEAIDLTSLLNGSPGIDLDRLGTINWKV